MKLIFILFLISLPALAQDTTEQTVTTPDEASSSQEGMKKKLPQNAEEERQEEEEASQLGPYDREGNYQIRIKPKDENVPTD